MNFLLWTLFLAGAAVKSDDSNNYYVIQMPEEPHRTLTKAFRVFWNVPTKQCKSKGIPFENLYERFGIIQNDNDSFRGEKVSILYDPGLFPALLKNESTGEYKFRNGGVPQEGDLEKHAEVFRSTLEESVPDPNFSGIGIIDFESWRPIFRQNFGVLTPYKDVSYQIERKKHWIWPESWIKAEAKQRFEEKARTFMHKTLSIAREMRPRAQWGYYGFPYCFNMAASNMRERCADRVPAENDEIYWLWLESTALYPSVYSPQSLTTQQLAQLVRGRIREAARVRKSGTPILPYFWFRYHSYNAGFLSEADLQTAIRTMYESEASGFILWGSSNDVNTVEKCKKLLQYVEKQLGPEVSKYTKYDRTQSVNDVGSENDDISSSSTATIPTSSERNPAFDEFDDEKTLKPKNESDFEYYADDDDGSEHDKNRVKVVDPQFDSENSWLRPQNHTRIIKKHFEDDKKTKDYLSYIDLSDKVTTEALLDDLPQPPLIDTRKLTNDGDLVLDTHSVLSTTEDGWNDGTTIATDIKSYKLKDEDDFEDTIPNQSTDENKFVDVIPILTEIKLDQSKNEQDLVDTIPIHSSSENEFIESITTSTEKLPILNNIANVESIDIMDETEKPINLNNIVDVESIDLMDEDFDTKYDLNTNKNYEEKQDELKMQDEIISKEYDPDESGSHSVHSVYEDKVLDKMRPIPYADKEDKQKIRTPLLENNSTVIIDNISIETNAPDESTTVLSLPAAFDLVFSRKRHYEPKNVDIATSKERNVQPMPNVKNKNSIKIQSDTDNLSFIENVQTFNDSVKNERNVLPNETNHKQVNAITNLNFNTLTNDSNIMKANEFSLTTEKLLANTTPTNNLLMFLKRPLYVDHNETNVNKSGQSEPTVSVNKLDKNCTNSDRNVTKLYVSTEKIASATELNTFSMTSTKLETKDEEFVTESQNSKVLISEVDKKGKPIESVNQHDGNRTNFDNSVLKLNITTENEGNATELTLSTTPTNTGTNNQEIMKDSQKTEEFVSGVNKNNNQIQILNKHDEISTNDKNVTTFYITTEVANSTELTTLSTTSTNTGTNEQEITYIMDSQKPEVFVSGDNKNNKQMQSLNKHDELSTHDKNVTTFYTTTEVANATKLTTPSTVSINTNTKEQEIIMEIQKPKKFISEVDKKVKPVENLSNNYDTSLNFDKNTKLYITTEEIANATEINTLSTTFTKDDTKYREILMEGQELKSSVSEVDKEEKLVASKEGMGATMKYSKMDDFNVPIQNDQVPSSGSHSRIGGFRYYYCILFYFYSVSKCICDYYGQCS